MNSAAYRRCRQLAGYYNVLTWVQFYCIVGSWTFLISLIVFMYAATTKQKYVDEVINMGLDAEEWHRPLAQSARRVITIVVVLEVTLVVLAITVLAWGYFSHLH